MQRVMTTKNVSIAMMKEFYVVAPITKHEEKKELIIIKASLLLA